MKKRYPYKKQGSNLIGKKTMDDEIILKTNPKK